MPTYQVRIDAGGTTSGQQMYEAGQEAIAQLRREAGASNRMTTRQAIEAAGGSGVLAGQITGQPPSSKAYKAVQRNLQRYAQGTRNPTAGTIDAYQAMYTARTGQKNAGLDRLLGVITGQVQAGTLPPGTLDIAANGVIVVRTGPVSKGHAEDRREREVNMRVPRSRNAEAAKDPLSEWLIQFQEQVTGRLSLETMNYIELTYTTR